MDYEEERFSFWHKDPFLNLIQALIYGIVALTLGFAWMKFLAWIGLG